METIKLSGPIAYYQFIKDDICINLFSDAHYGNNIYNCNELYRDETINICKLLLYLYNKENNISFLLEGHPEENKPSDDFNDYLTTTSINLRNCNTNQLNKIQFTDFRENKFIFKNSDLNLQESLFMNLFKFAINNNWSNFMINGNYNTDDYEKYIKIYILYLDDLFNTITPLIKTKIFKNSWLKVIELKNELNKNIDQFDIFLKNNLYEESKKIFNKINDSFVNIQRLSVDYLTIDVLLIDIQNNYKNFILYYGYNHISNMIEILKQFGFIQIINIINNEKDRCLSLSLNTNKTYFMNLIPSFNNSLVPFEGGYTKFEILLNKYKVKVKKKTINIKKIKNKKNETYISKTNSLDCIKIPILNKPSNKTPYWLSK